MIYSSQTDLTEIMPLLVIVVVFLVYKYSTYHYKHWEKRGVPHIEPLPLLGNFADATLGRENGALNVDSLYWHFDGHRYFGMYQLRNPVFVIRDPELSYTIMNKDFNSFYDRLNGRVSFKHDELFKSLVNLKGEKWKAVRSKLSPTFTAAKLKAMFSDLHICTDHLIKKLSQLTPDNQGVVNVTDIMSKFTIDTIGRCAFGLDCNSLFDTNSEFQRAGEAVFKPTIKSLLVHNMRLIDFGWLVDLLRLRKMPNYVYEFYLNIFRDTLKLREAEKEERNDFVSILIKLRNAEKANDSSADLFTDEVLASNAFVFFAAGFETTATTMSYCLYQLALNQDIQTELREQIKLAINENEGKLTYDVIKDIKYLDMILNETLRLYTPFPDAVRVCTKKYKLPDSDLILDVGTKVLIPLYSYHNDSKYYPNPKVFDPLRFTEENKASRPKGTYVPFGDGPRGCIGFRFAMMEAKTGLAEIISKFEILPCEDTQIPIFYNPFTLLLKPTVPIRLVFKKIFSYETIENRT